MPWECLFGGNSGDIILISLDAFRVVGITVAWQEWREWWFRAARTLSRSAGIVVRRRSSPDDDYRTYIELMAEWCGRWPVCLFSVQRELSALPPGATACVPGSVAKRKLGN